MSDDKDKSAANPKAELSVERLDKVAGGAPAQPAGTKADKPHLSEIVVTKKVDASSTDLF
jgi:hypothetical protein